MSATQIRASPYRKPKERKKLAAQKVKRIRLALGLTQTELAATLTRMAIKARHANVTSVWAVQAWEKAYREPDAVRMGLLDKLDKGTSDGSAPASE
jgi:DNA-binding transcriptional regulator YiaG